MTVPVEFTVSRDALIVTTLLAAFACWFGFQMGAPRVAPYLGEGLIWEGGLTDFGAAVRALEACVGLVFFSAIGYFFISPWAGLFVFGAGIAVFVYCIFRWGEGFTVISHY